MARASGSGTSEGGGARGADGPREQKRAAKAGSSIKILIADDQLAVGEALQIALGAEHDLTVIEVVTEGEDAVEAAASREPDVVLLDLQRPGMDGVEAARRITERAPSSAVIVLSGEGDEMSLARAVQAGARGFLRKSEGVGGLADAIRRAHRGEPLHEPTEVEASMRRLRRRRARDSGIAKRLDRLTPRELEILQSLADGRSAAEVAQTLGMSPHTLRTHTQNVLTKLGVHSKLEAIVAAIRHGKVRTSDPDE
ncbi:MAG: response regulator transcription factor [Actinobacteria bacterium]|nr:response regulator transcription factor [Actinomycetota bacterium]